MSSSENVVCLTSCQTSIYSQISVLLLSPMKSCSTFPCEELAHRQCAEPAGTLTVWGVPEAFMMDNLLFAFRFPLILKGVTSALILQKQGISSYSLHVHILSA